MGNEAHDFLPATDESGPQPGPSWGNPRWPPVGGDSEDELTQALDLTAMTPADKAAAAKSGKAMDGQAVEQAAADSIRAMMLVRTYRVRGHLAAELDPLGISHRELPADLTPEYHGFTGAALERPLYVGGTLGLEWTTM